jgi:hypothetical protein
MRFISPRAAAFVCSAALTFICSCEKHHVGEYPEVQRDRLHEAKHPAHQTQPAASPSATPVDFFAEQKAH